MGDKVDGSGNNHENGEKVKGQECKAELWVTKCEGKQTEGIMGDCGMDRNDNKERFI